MSDLQTLKVRWESIGFELRSLENQRFYLTRTFQDVIFIVRHASDSVILPRLDHGFRVCFKDRETGILNAETRRANGIDDLLNLILNWRRELHPPITHLPSAMMLAGRHRAVTRPAEHA